jgi:hypothetical protein
MHLGCCSTFVKRKNTLACGSSIFTLSESLATSLVHGSRNPARKYDIYLVFLRERRDVHIKIQFNQVWTIHICMYDKNIPIIIYEYYLNI